jgi:hypothetical protein
MQKHATEFAQDVIRGHPALSSPEKLSQHITQMFLETSGFLREVVDAVTASLECTIFIITNPPVPHQFRFDTDICIHFQCIGEDDNVVGGKVIECIRCPNGALYGDHALDELRYAIQKELKIAMQDKYIITLQ